MPLRKTRRPFGDESAAVVPHGEKYQVAFGRTCDPDMAGAAVADCVQHELAYDAHERVSGLVRQPFARYVEADGEFGVADIGLKRTADGLVQVRFLKGLAAQVPQAVAQLVAAGLERRGGDGEMGERQTDPPAAGLV